MIDKFLSSRKIAKPFWVLIGIILLIGVSFLDYITGTELSFSLFYLIPISLFSLLYRGNVGIWVAVVCAGVWLVIELFTETAYSNNLVYVWNAIIRLGFFLVPALLLKSWEKEREYARTDFLTGTFNARYFNELLQREIDRSQRYKHPFTIAFIDIDNFKLINDTRGHAFGDHTLRSIAEILTEKLRKTDIVARLGGDEFVVLFPEMNEEISLVVISKLFRDLVRELQEKNLSATLSVGVLTVINSEITPDKVLNITDELMYLVKNSGKNNIRYQAYK